MGETVGLCLQIPKNYKYLIKTIFKIHNSRNERENKIKGKE